MVPRPLENACAMRAAENGLKDSTNAGRAKCWPVWPADRRRLKVTAVAELEELPACSDRGFSSRWLALKPWRASCRWINLRHVRGHTTKERKGLRGFHRRGTYAKSIRYTEAKTAFGMVTRPMMRSCSLSPVDGLLPASTKADRRLGRGVWGRHWSGSDRLLLGLPGLSLRQVEHLQAGGALRLQQEHLKPWITDKLKGPCSAWRSAAALALQILLWNRGSALVAWGFTVFFLFQLSWWSFTMFISRSTTEPMDGEGELRVTASCAGRAQRLQAKTILLMGGRKRRPTRRPFRGSGVPEDRALHTPDREMSRTNSKPCGPRDRPLQSRHLPSASRSSAVTTSRVALLGWLAQAAGFPEAYHFSA